MGWKDKVTVTVDNYAKIKNVYRTEAIILKNNDFFNTRLENILSFPYIDNLEQGHIVLRNGESKNLVLHTHMDRFKRVEFLVNEMEIPEDSSILLFCNLFSEHEQNAVIRFGGISQSKVWINNEFVGMTKSYISDSYGLLYMLKAGDNFVAVQCKKNEGDQYFTFSLRADAYLDSPVTEKDILMKESADCLYKNSLRCISEEYTTFCNSDRDISDFMLIKTDFINIHSNEIQIIFKNEQEEIIEEIFSCFFQKVTCSQENFLECYTKGYLLFSDVIFSTVENSNSVLAMEMMSFIKNWVLIEKDYLKKYEMLKSEFGNMINDEDEINIIGRIQSLNKISPSTVKQIIFELDRIFEYIRSKKHFINYFYEQKSTIYYYESKLDGLLSNLSIALPPKYEMDKYPLVLYSRIDMPPIQFFYQQRKFVKENVLMASINGRGMTCGSYMGETAWLEAIELIKLLYPIDDDRIYMIGLSNSAYATWALAQNHPDLFAAIGTFGGAANKENLKNISNVGVYNVCGDCDEGFELMYQVPTEFLEPFGNYCGVVFPLVDHYGVNDVWYVNHVIKKLLEFKKEKLVRRISFRTERIRHSKSFWIGILHFTKSQYPCEIHAEWDANKILVYTENVKAFCVFLSEMKDAKINKIIINGKQEIHINEFTEDDIYFDSAENHFFVSKKVRHQKELNCAGMGILDIYMEHMKVLIPYHFLLGEEDIVRKIANVLAKPFFNTVYSEINVQYKIQSEIIKIKDIDSNIVCIGLNQNKNHIEQILKLFPFDFSDNGYSYKDKYIEGKYCVLSIISFNNKRILLVYSNDLTVLKRCLFLRKMIIPTYTYGRHPFLNNDTLIFDGVNYFRIQTMGDDIKKIEMRTDDE